MSKFLQSMKVITDHVMKSSHLTDRALNLITDIKLKTRNDRMLQCITNQNNTNYYRQNIVINTDIRYSMEI